jgi:hypothetical protein
LKSIDFDTVKPSDQKISKDKDIVLNQTKAAVQVNKPTQASQTLATINPHNYNGLVHYPSDKQYEIVMPL